MSTDYLLWQWSLTAQLASALMIAGFFAALRSSFPTAEVRVWTWAWAANLLSLVVTFIDLYWVRSVEGPALRAIFGLYIFGKGWFVVQMAHGLWLAANPGRAPRPLGWPAAAIATASLAAGLYLHDYMLLSLFAQFGIFAGFFVAALLPTGHQPVGWLVRGIGLRALLSVVETLVYAAQTAPPLVALPWMGEPLARFSAVSSSFDMLTEWLIALGCVLAATGRAHRELAAANDDLHQAQQSLRALVEVDALTGLASRRALPGIMRSVHADGAGLLFVDLRGFKAINDSRGHQAGDDALRQFAAVLRHGFRPDDAAVRYGGDEFLVVARGLNRAQTMDRVAALRSRLAAAGDWARGLAFDAGYADLPPGGALEDAIRLADQAMYEAKAAATPSRSVPEGAPGHGTGSLGAPGARQVAAGQAVAVDRGPQRGAVDLEGQLGAAEPAAHLGLAGSGRERS